MMSAATKTLLTSRPAISLPAIPLLGRPVLRNTLLLSAVMVTALGLLLAKDTSRRLFIEYQGLEKVHEQQYETWGKLLLEQSTLSRQARVSQIAVEHLNMVLPTSKQVSILKID